MTGRPSIRIGNQTAFSAATLMLPFEYAVSQGFEAFEWFPDKKEDGSGWEESDLNPDQRHEIRGLARARGIRLSVHARWQANPLLPEARDFLLKDLELAEALGAKVFNLHLYAEQGLARYVQSITWLVERLAGGDLQLAIENTPLTTPRHFNELFARLHDLRCLPAGRVGMCLDLGHANLCQATRNDYLGYIDQLDAHVPFNHLHVHENWGDHDSHLPIFTGPAAANPDGLRGFIERLRRRDYAGSMILEQWPHPPSLLDQANERLKELLTAAALPQGVAAPGKARAAIPEPWRPGESCLNSEVSAHASTGVATVSDEEDDFAQALIQADRRCRSWREKLGFIHGLFTDETRPMTDGQLIDLAIYLRFLGTGKIPCAEDGRHFRPSHHARKSGQIQARLATLARGGNEFVIRKLIPWLPSSIAAFTRPEPLTRIRDIAHRNDLPPELKREIKTTLQNKLHRCAGPEDLATSAALLERITAPGGGYAPALIEQFKIFHEELKEFFNARSLEERLKAVAEATHGEEADLIRQFLAEKQRVESAHDLPPGTAAYQPPIRLASRRSEAALATLTKLRQRLLERVEKNPGPETQEFLLADIGLEDFAFVWLSEMLSLAENEPGDAAWAPLLQGLSLSLANLALSGISPDEVRALESETNTWRHHFSPTDRESMLRIKATLGRCLRLAEDFSDGVMELFARRAGQLGKGLGVADHAIRIFCEGEIRGHLMFQLSKLAALLLRRVHERLDLAPWNVLASGTASGRLQSCEALAELTDETDGPVVAWLKRAEGDEDIPRGVSGMVLAHSMPRLSHLGVRARQARVVFVTCEDQAKFAGLAGLAGQRVRLEASEGGVTVEACQRTQAPNQRAAAPTGLRAPEVWLEPSCRLIALAEAVLQNGGGKAVGARRLEELSRLEGAGFKTPPAWVVPFGIMEQALRSQPILEREYRTCLARMENLEGPDLVDAAQAMRFLLKPLEAPAAVLQEIASVFPATDRLMVRSSSNFEDLAHFSGAGLHESLANVSPADVSEATVTVWASLWTPRAALSRRQAGVPHDQIHMAVLIQRMVVPQYSFHLHTVHPIHKSSDELYLELAVGLGETIASGAAPGLAYQMIGHKKSGATEVLSFANFSHALRPGKTGSVERRVLDYSTVELSRDAKNFHRLGKRLLKTGCWVEAALGGPQDIEGVVSGEEVYLVQCRAQQGLESASQT